MKKKITLDKLAEMTQRGFLDVRKELRVEIGVVKEEMATLKDELKGDITELRGELKGDMAILKDDIIDVVLEENLKVIRSNDVVVTKLDILLKEHAADKSLHDSHTKRLYRLERKVGI